jgi:hypothetical protein
MRRRLFATSIFTLAAGLGLGSLTGSSASLAAATDPPSGAASQRVLVEQLQVTVRLRLAQAEAQAAQDQAQADARAAAADADRARAAAQARAARAVRFVPPSYGPVDWRTLVAQYPWDATVAGRVLWCESRGDPNAQSRSGANGLFQILGGPFEPAANVATAYQMYASRGWQPWSASRSCWA